MSIVASVKIVSPVARALTEGRRMAVLKSMFAPVSEVVRSLQNPVRPNLLAFSTRIALESEDQVAGANEILVGADQAAIGDQVGNLVRAVNAMTFTARNVIVPTVDALVNQYLNRQAASNQPNVSVNVFKYNDVHSEPALVNHVSSKYSDVMARPEYRSFILQQLSAEGIVTLVSEKNPHLDRAQVIEWLLEMGADRIAAVWTKLFGTSRTFDFTTASWMHPSNWPMQVDELLLAYCLTGSMLEEPREVIGESVDLAEWERAMGVLHELIGSKLLQAYTYRAQDAKNQRLIITSDAKDAMRTGVVAVLVNGDVYNGWLSAGGDIQALLGAAIYEPALKTATALAPVAADLSARWSKYYPVLRQACVDNCVRGRRRDVATVFLSSSIPSVEGLPAIDQGVAQQRLDAELRSVQDDQYDKPFQLFAELVCRVYYPTQPLYVGFMRSMDRYAKIHPEATGRELAVEASLELIATWLCSQIDTVGYTPVVDPSAVNSNEDDNGANVAIAPENEEVAGEIVETADNSPIDEVAEPAEADAEQEPVVEEADAEQEPVVEEGDAEQEAADSEPTTGEESETADDAEEDEQQ